MFFGKYLAPFGEFFKFITSPINLGAIIMLFGFLLVFVVSLITKKPDEKVVQNAFSCYDKKVVVSASSALTDGYAETEEKAEE